MTDDRTLATPANMRSFEQSHPAVFREDGFGTLQREEPLRAIAYSPTTGETFPAASGDYASFDDEEPLRDSSGQPMLLVVRFSGYRDALTDAEFDGRRPTTPRGN